MTTHPLNMSLPGYTGEITAGIAGALLLILCIISLILYRNWRYEQELDSLLWKIDFKELTVHESDKDLSEKKQTRVRIDIPIAGGAIPRNHFVFAWVCSLSTIEFWATFSIPLCVTGDPSSDPDQSSEPELESRFWFPLFKHFHADRNLQGTALRHKES